MAITLNIRRMIGQFRTQGLSLTAFANGWQYASTQERWRKKKEKKEKKKGGESFLKSDDVTSLIISLSRSSSSSSSITNSTRFFPLFSFPPPNPSLTLRKILKFTKIKGFNYAQLVIGHLGLREMTDASSSHIHHRVFTFV